MMRQQVFPVFIAGKPKKEGVKMALKGGGLMTFWQLKGWWFG